MTESSQTAALLISILGIVFILAAVVRRSCSAIGIPTLIGYLLLGFVLKLTDIPWDWLAEPAVEHAFTLLADMGIVVLLFRVGMEMEPRHLIRQLPQSSLVFVFNMLISALVGYATAYYVLDLSHISSLMVATALTATSIGVSVAVWQEAGMLRSRNGHLLVNVAELDDIAAVALFALLFSIVPTLRDGGSFTWGPVLETGGAFLITLILFAVGCYLFSRYCAAWLSHMGQTLEYEPRTMMTVMGAAFLIAGVGGWLGLSLAVGALFAGLVFAQDSGAWKNVRAFDFMHRYIAPFFFIEIGMHLEPGALLAGLEMGLWLIVAGIVGKIVGTTLPARLITDRRGALLLGISMVPRAEIALLIAAEGRNLGVWAISDELYAGFVVMAAATCVIGPAVLRPMLAREA